MSKSFYLTTTLPYVNADPHIGFALELVHADILARYHALQGDDVFFNTGTDEHGLKIYRKAEEVGKSPQEYTDEYAAKFRSLKEKLGLSDGKNGAPDLHFIRTTDPHHKKAAQKFWELCVANGDIEKKFYKTKYCIGCELDKTDSELVDGKCPVHPNLDVEVREEENYFFKFSKYQKPLLDMYEKNPAFVVPDFRFNEIKKFVEKGIEDFSISRLKEKMPWGVPVPGDDEHVMYVWFDALINYISTLGWPENTTDFERFWGTKGKPNAIQMAGKDQIRQQAAMWQAMLMSAGLPPTKQIAIHGFITVGGQKMSKSLGNVIDPIKIVDEYGADALRYFLARHIHPFEDSDFTMERFKEAYNADLANGLGNIVARVMKLAETHLKAPPDTSKWFEGIPKEYFDNFAIDKAAEEVQRLLSNIDLHITTTKPFKRIKDQPERAIADLELAVRSLWKSALWMEQFMPSTSKQIKEAIKQNKKPKNLFPRLDEASREGGPRKE